MIGEQTSGGWTTGARRTAEMMAMLPLAVPAITVTEGVYEPSVDSALLCRAMTADLTAMTMEPTAMTVEPTAMTVEPTAMTVEPTGPVANAPRVLDLCTGSGVAAIYAALAGARVTAVDDTDAALAAVRGNASANGVAIEVLRADVRARPWLPTADLVVANPPYVPAPYVPAPYAPAQRGGLDGHAWDAGADGRETLDAIIAQLPALLRPDGRAILVHSHVNGIERSMRALRDRGLHPSICAETSVEFGPVMTARSSWLRQAGLIVPGESTERLVAIRATRSPGGTCSDFG